AFFLEEQTGEGIGPAADPVWFPGCLPSKALPGSVPARSSDLRAAYFPSPSRRLAVASRRSFVPAYSGGAVADSHPLPVGRHVVSSMRTPSIVVKEFVRAKWSDPFTAGLLEEEG